MTENRVRDLLKAFAAGAEKTLRSRLLLKCLDPSTIARAAAAQIRALTVNPPKPAGEADYIGEQWSGMRWHSLQAAHA